MLLLCVFKTRSKHSCRPIWYTLNSKCFEVLQFIIDVWCKNNSISYFHLAFFLFLECGETESLGTKTVSGPLYPALDDRWQMVHFLKWELAGEIEVLGVSLPESHFVHQKSQMNWSRIEPHPTRWKARDLPLELWRGVHCSLLKKKLGPSRCDF
jgi:hypothetical protein